MPSGAAQKRQAAQAAQEKKEQDAKQAAAAAAKAAAAKAAEEEEAAAAKKKEVVNADPSDGDDDGSGSDSSSSGDESELSADEYEADEVSDEMKTRMLTPRATDGNSDYDYNSHPAVTSLEFRMTKEGSTIKRKAVSVSVGARGGICICIVDLLVGLYQHRSVLHIYILYCDL